MDRSKTKYRVLYYETTRQPHGLAISMSIVESHGGRIWDTGTGGRSATFHFTLAPRKQTSGCRVIRHAAEWIRVATQTVALLSNISGTSRSNL
jgi:hypothetical protein